MAMVRETLLKWGIASFSVLLVVLCGCDDPGAKLPRAITSAEQMQITQAPLAAMAQARSKRDGALFFEAGKELISSKKIYDMTIEDLFENIGKTSVHNWEASRFFGLPTGRDAWLFHVDKAIFFVAVRWGKNRSIRKARVYWMDGKGDEIITQYPPEDKDRREREMMAAMILAYYLSTLTMEK
jgi:hypothetical protein